MRVGGIELLSLCVGAVHESGVGFTDVIPVHHVFNLARGCCTFQGPAKPHKIRHFAKLSNLSGALL